MISKAEEIVAGLQILVKYGYVEVSAEHDEIFAEPTKNISVEDVALLKTLGWEYVRSLNCYKIYT
jgi:hypothetical protein